MKEKVIHAIQDEYPNDFAWCLGCGRLNKEGYHFRTGWEGERTVTYHKPSKRRRQFQVLFMAAELHH